MTTPSAAGEPLLWRRSCITGRTEREPRKAGLTMTDGAAVQSPLRPVAHSANQLTLKLNAEGKQRLTNTDCVNLSWSTLILIFFIQLNEDTRWFVRNVREGGLCVSLHDTQLMCISCGCPSSWFTINVSVPYKCIFVINCYLLLQVRRSWGRSSPLTPGRMEPAIRQVCPTIYCMCLLILTHHSLYSPVLGFLKSAHLKGIK